MQKKIIVLVISVISLCYGGSLYAWGDNWGNDKTSNNMDVYNGGWSSSGGKLDSMRDMSPWNTDITWEGGICKNDGSVSLTTVFSRDALSKNINGLDIQYTEGGKDIYALNSLDNHLFALTAPTNNDSVIWSHDPASSMSLSTTTVPSVTVVSSKKALISIPAHEGAVQTAIDVEFDAGSGIEKITFRGYKDSGETYIVGYLNVHSDPGVNLTVKISDDAKSLEIFNKYQPGSSLSASIDTESYKDEILVFINLKEKGEVNEYAAKVANVAILNPNGEIEVEYRGTPCTEYGSSVTFENDGDISLATSLGTFGVFS